MELVDVYCGVGGFSCGAMQAGCKAIMGVDCEDGVLRLWAANTQGRARLARLWGDTSVEWPFARSNLHVHLSPPCTALSSARRGASQSAVNGGLESIRRALDFVLEKSHQSWSIENVPIPAVRELMHRYAISFPDKVAYCIVDSADLGAPTTRQRLIAGPPKLIRRLRETPVKRTSVSEAFKRAGVGLPAEYIKNGTRTRDRKPCVRSTMGPAHTVTASHPLTWCEKDGRTVRCLNVKETAILQGFPSDWLLPTGSRAGISALGNAVIPCVAEAIMRAALPPSEHAADM